MHPNEAKSTQMSDQVKHKNEQKELKSQKSSGIASLWRGLHAVLTGFTIAAIIRMCGMMARTHLEIIGNIANLAAATAQFLITLSYKQIAKRTGRSISTVKRAIAAAIECGLITVTNTVNDQRMKDRNAYQFTEKFLRHAVAVVAKCEAENVAPESESGRANFITKNVINSMQTQQSGMVHDELSGSGKIQETQQSGMVQNEPTKENTSSNTKRSKIKTKKRETQCVRKTQVIHKRVVLDILAAEKALADNQRKQEKFDAKGKVMETATKLAKKFAFLQNRENKRTDTGVFGTFADKPADHWDVPEHYGFRT